MDNTPLRRAVWNGSIPCRIELDPAESRAFDAAAPYFISLPRVSYIPLYIGGVHRFFEPFLIDPNICKLGNAWLEFENVPLKWHWPVGVLYDLFTGRDPSSNPRNTDDEDHRLPWNLTLRFQNFPSKHMMRMDTPSSLQDVWINCVKEATFSRYGNAKAVMGLSKAESTKLWEGLSSHDFEKFWNINDKLIAESSGPLRSYALRVYVPSTPRVVQQPVPPFLMSKEPQTIGTALHSLLPELFPSKRTPVLARPVIHGVVVSMNTPLAEFVQVAVYPDGFVHITLAMSG